MEQVRKANIIEHWPTYTISTPVFPHTISGNHYEPCWQAQNFSDNSQQTQDAGRLI